ncbi:MAG: hypothetical protein PVF83_16300 [Anaerolineales bacterium]
MQNEFSTLLDKLSEFLAARKGLLPLIGIILVLVNFIIQFIPGGGILVESNFFLHLGVVIAVIGFLIAKAL